MDNRKSLLNGGLEGHKEGIYCLQIFNWEMSFSSPATSSPSNSNKDSSSSGIASISTTAHNRRSSFDASQKDVPFAEGKNWLFSGSRDKSIRLWDLNTSKVVKIFNYDTTAQKGHTGSVLSICVAPITSLPGPGKIGIGIGGVGNGNKSVRMISGGSDGKLIVWDVGSGRIVKEIQAHERTEAVLCVRFDERRIVSCSKGEPCS